MTLQNIFNLFKKGSEIDNPALWKSVQLKANNVTTLLVAVSSIAAIYGYDFHISEELMQTMGAGIVAFLTIANSVLTVITSKKAGL
ncbi:MAG: hypothetical protein M0R47_15955 [Methylobacter sp.]|uniref:hypothetical protein n=1 Tax=Methylobacter sp. TaxID=2051955 RepID=UPI0025E3DFAD|nr:hypothetical protein [Methylobacter sp.]MCK9622015.1 hypothetical protein [Methylobacter sp.]